MSMFRRKTPNHFIRIDPNNMVNKDWLILLEAGTIVGNPRKLRVAACTQERKVIKKRGLFRRREYYLDIDGYDPRIHAVYFCPQLYKNDAEKNLVPLAGEEIGTLIAHALESGTKERRPWYLPSDALPAEPAINMALEPDFESLVVEMPQRNSVAA